MSTTSTSTTPSFPTPEEMAAMTRRIQDFDAYIATEFLMIIEPLTEAIGTLLSKCPAEQPNSPGANPPMVNTLYSYMLHHNHFTSQAKTIKDQYEKTLAAEAAAKATPEMLVATGPMP